MSDTTDTRSAATPAALPAADLERLLKLHANFPSEYYGVMADDRQSCWLARASDGARLAVFPANGDEVRLANLRMAALEFCWRAAPQLVAEIQRLQVEVAARAAAQAAAEAEVARLRAALEEQP